MYSSCSTSFHAEHHLDETGNDRYIICCLTNSNFSGIHFDASSDSRRYSNAYTHIYLDIRATDTYTRSNAFRERS
jgi:hypothetical protein